MSVSIGVRSSAEGYFVTDCITICIGDRSDFGNFAVRDHDPLQSAAPEHHVDCPNILGQILGVCLDGDAGRQSAGHVRIAIDGLQDIGIQSLDQREAELIKLRESFAKEQKEALEKLIAKEKELSTIKVQLKNLQKHTNSLQQRTNSLQKKTESLNSMLEQERRDKKRLEEEYQSLSKIISSQIEEN